MVLIYGTASSGKSNIAEDMAVLHSKGTGSSLVYIATMENKTDAARERIKRHRQLREGKGFLTIEEMHKLSVHDLSVSGKTVLIECISNLCANIYYKEMGDKGAKDSDIERMTEFVIDGVKKLSKTADEIFIVSNDIFSDGTIHDPWTESYMMYLAHVNEELVKICDSFYEVINGIAYLHKGQEEKA